MLPDRVRCRSWDQWDVFPIIPPTAFYIREVGQHPQYISGKFFDFVYSKGCMKCLVHLPQHSTEIYSKTKLQRIRLELLDFEQGSGTSLFQRGDQTRKAGRNRGSNVFTSLALSPLTLPSTISSITTLAAKLHLYAPPTIRLEM